jgi:hypothetical protein
MGPYLDLWHHIYQDNYYNSAEIAEKLLLRKTRVCRTRRTSRGIPKSLTDSSKKLKRNNTIVCQKGDVLLHIWKDKGEVCMISTMYNDTIGEGTNKFGERIKKQTSVTVHEGC